MIYNIMHAIVILYTSNPSKWYSFKEHPTFKEEKKFHISPFFDYLKLPCIKDLSSGPKNTKCRQAHYKMFDYVEI